jgi:hypothetical protein
LWTVDRGAGTYAYELHGAAQVGVGREPYAILDRDPVAVDLDYQILANPGQVTTIVVRVEFDHILEVIDFSAAPLVNGVRTIGAGDAQLPRIRTEVERAFGVHASDQL